MFFVWNFGFVDIYVNYIIFINNYKYVYLLEKKIREERFEMYRKGGNMVFIFVKWN